MNSRRLNLFAILLLPLAIFPACLLSAQTTMPPGLPSVTALKSPVDLFREMLAAPPASLEKDLAARPTEVRARLLAKLKEYQALPPEERELRLQLTQLRWNLLRLLPLASEQRAGQMANLRLADRKLVSDRLEQWDHLSPEVRQAVLRYEKTIEQIVTQNSAPAPGQGTEPMAVPSPPELPKDLGNFLKLPLEQRRQVFSSFEQFFELSANERQSTLAALGPPLPPEASNTLANLQNLPATQRGKYLVAVQKFSSMSDLERQEFLKNAARWKELTPAERQAWRNLVNNLPAPQMPQEISVSLMPPPLPPPMAVRMSFHGNTNSP